MCLTSEGRPVDQLIRFGGMTQARDIKSGVVSTEMGLKTVNLGEVSKGVSIGRKKFKAGPQRYDSVQRSGRNREDSKGDKEEENQEGPGPGSHMREVVREERVSAGGTVGRQTGGLGPDNGRWLVALRQLSMEGSLRYVKSKTKQV